VRSTLAAKNAPRGATVPRFSTSLSNWSMTLVICIWLGGAEACVRTCGLGFVGMGGTRTNLFEVHRLGGGLQALDDAAHGLGDRAHPDRGLYARSHRVDARGQSQVVPGGWGAAEGVRERRGGMGGGGERTGLGSSHGWHSQRRCERRPCCLSRSPVQMQRQTNIAQNHLF